MTRHLFSLMVVIWETLIISENQASPEPQFASTYYPPAFYAYFKPAYFSNQKFNPSYQHQAFYPYLQQLPGPYYQSVSGPNDPQGEDYHEISPTTEKYEKEEDPYSRIFFGGLACPGPLMLLPCNCVPTRNPLWSLPAGNIVCPALTVAQVQSTFSRIPARKNIKTVTLNLPRGANVANSLPASFTTNHPQTAINIVSPNDASCIDSTLLSPCTCAGGTITCPAGNTLAQIQAVFNNIARNTNLGDVIINLPGGVNSNIPANFLGGNPANSITLIGPAAGTLSLLTIDPNTFDGSAATGTAITIQQFDVKNLDYSFLNGFNILTTFNLNNCVNNPTAANRPKNLANLPKLISVLVNGVPYKKVCPSAASLTPCTCDGSGVVALTTCPAGTTIAQIQAVFTKLPSNSNLGNVVLNFPLGATTAIPASVLGNNAAVGIEVIGPIGSSSVLTIDSGAFTSSAATALKLTLTSFNVANVDYSFLKNFNVLTVLHLKTCTSVPTKANPPKNLPTLPILSAGQNVLIDGVPYERVCPSTASLTPCACDGSGLQAKITCPAGITLTRIQDVFKGLPPNSNLGDVILNFPSGAITSIPESILGNNAAYTIEVVGPAEPSILTIDPASFSASANAAVQFTFTSFDMGNVDYSFLSNFNALVTVNFNKCTYSPTALDQLTNFPKNLPKFKAVIVDGKPITN